VSKKPWEAGRFGIDQRCRSQISYVQSAAAVAIGGRVPSDSQIVRRAIGLLIDHYQNMIEAGRAGGLKGPHLQDATAEREALDEYAGWVDASPPLSLVDKRGRLRSWHEAVSSAFDLGLSIPTKAA
jgi:hypothetical protein